MADENIINEGIRLYKNGNWTAALTYFMSLPDDSGINVIELAYYLGLCYTKLKRYDDALLYLEQVVTAGDQDAKYAGTERVLQCRYILAVIYCLSGRKKLSDFELKKLLETGYRTSSVYASLAYIAWEQDNVQLSMDYYAKSLEENEANPTALNGFGYILACEGTELTKALSMCKKALDLYPESSACLDTLGWIYFKMGLMGESKKYLKKALKNDSSNKIIQEHLAEVQKAGE